MRLEVNIEIINRGEMFLAFRAFVDDPFMTTGDVLLEVFILSERLGAMRTSERLNGVGDRLDAESLLVVI